MNLHYFWPDSAGIGGGYSRARVWASPFLSSRRLGAPRVSSDNRIALHHISRASRVNPAASKYRAIEQFLSIERTSDSTGFDNRCLSHISVSMRVSRIPLPGSFSSISHFGLSYPPPRPPPPPAPSTLSIEPEGPSIFRRDGPARCGTAGVLFLYRLERADVRSARSFFSLPARSWPHVRRCSHMILCRFAQPSCYLRPSLLRLDRALSAPCLVRISSFIDPNSRRRVSVSSLFRPDKQQPVALWNLPQPVIAGNNF